jgi:HPt (histidine-containing phosphotransfer) domain-containing protein
MDDYLSKPIRDRDLFSVIEKFASKPKKKRQAKHISRPRDIESSAQEVFDLSAAMKSVSGDKALFGEIANLFLESAADNMSKIRQGIASSDASAVETAAHALKGSVSNFGAKRAFAAAYRLECLGKQGKLTEARSANSELEAELRALEAAMKFALQE